MKRGQWILLAISVLCRGVGVIGVRERNIAAARRLQRLLTDGREAMMSAKWNEAINAYSEVLKISPDSLEALDQLGDAYEGDGQLAKASTDYFRAITIKPQSPRDYAFRGEAYLSLRDAGYPPSLDLAKEGEHDLEQAVKMKALTPFDLVQRGGTYEGLHQLRLALDDFNEAIRLEPNAVLAFDDRGYVYLRLGKPDGAISDYTRFIEGASNGVLGLLNRGHVYFLMKERDLALKDLDQAIRMAPDAAMFWDSRGRMKRDWKQYDLALGDFDQAIHLDHKSYLFADRARLYFDMKKNDLAVRDLDEAIREDPQNISAYNLRIACRISQQDFSKVLEDCNEVLRLDPKNLDGYRARSLVDYFLGRDKDAAQDDATFKRLLSADPEFRQN